MKQIKSKWVQAVDLLFFLGGALVSFGVGLWVCPAAGLVAAGVFCLVASVLTERNGDGKGGDGTA